MPCEDEENIIILKLINIKLIRLFIVLNQVAFALGRRRRVFSCVATFE